MPKRKPIWHTEREISKDLSGLNEEEIKRLLGKGLSPKPYDEEWYKKKTSKMREAAGGGRPIVAPFIPPSIANLFLWPKSDVGLFKDAAKAQPAGADGDQIYTWSDQSPRAGDGTQSVAGQRPTLKLAQQNGLPAVLFTPASSQYLSIPGLALSSFSFFAVLKAADASTYRVILGGNNDGAPVWRIQNTGQPYLEKGAQVAIGTANTDIGVAAFKLIVATYDGTNFSFRLNGAADGNGANAQVFASNLTNVGRNTTGAPFYFSGLIGELLAYNSVLSVVDIASIETYLNVKWRLY